MATSRIDDRTQAIDKGDLARLEQLAKLEDRPVSYVLRRAIDHYIRRKRRDPSTLEIVR